MRQLVNDPSTVISKAHPNLVRKTIEDVLSDPMDVRNRRIRIKSFDEISPINDAPTFDMFRNRIQSNTN